ncbi:MAG: glycosyltransferase [Chloroflexi bacterium]|nr:glycosyltransferase [Chloroflexota bacterium]
MTAASDARDPEGAGRGRRRTRIASLVYGVGGRETGVRRLILDQAKAWSNLAPDVDVGLFVRCEAGTEEAWRDEANVVAVRSSGFGIVGRYVARELLALDLARWRPDVVYLRHGTVSPSMLAVALRYPTVVGGDLDDLDELRIRSRLRYWYMRISRTALLRRARHVIVVTNEIAAHPTLRRLRVPVTVLPNSIDLGSYPELPAPGNEAPRLVFLGSPRLAWAGVDKISRLAALFPDWRFDVIGPDPAELPDAPPNVAVHGRLERADYLPIMARADVALGPLALHRKSLSESSALKVAEYVALGIPVILANAEAAFPGDVPFLLQLPNTEDNIDASFDAVREFVEVWRGRRVPRSAIRPIDTSVVERERLGVMLGLASHGRRGAEEPPTSELTR